MKQDDLSNALDKPEWVLRTLVFVDVVESVRLMEQNENDFVRRWRHLVRTIEKEILPPNRGRLVKSHGDGLLLEFSGVTSAVKAAYALQCACTSVNTDEQPDRHILLRAGVHVGHLIADELDLYGSGVNLAARLLTLAGPGEIVVSADVRDQLAPVLDADVEDLGLCYLKHVHEPVRAYRIGPPGPRPVIEPHATSMPQLRPTVAVVPFVERADNPEHPVVGEVLADEIISALSRSSELDVISRLSTTIFRGRGTSADDVGRYLDANYVLSGAYRRVGGRLRLNVELASSQPGKIVWSDTVEIDVLNAGADGVAHDMVTSINRAIMAREVERAQARALPTLEGYTLLVGAIALMFRLSVRDFDRSGQMLQTLIERFPRQAIPWAWMAMWHVQRTWSQRWAGNPTVGTQLALDCVRRALDADPQCSLALTVSGMVQSNILRKLDVAEEQYAMALRINPNDSLAWASKGVLHAFKTEGKLAIQHTQRALKLSPLDPNRHYYDSLAATAALSGGGAIQTSDRACKPFA
jgi:adenylate cyclase